MTLIVLRKTFLAIGISMAALGMSDVKAATIENDSGLVNAETLITFDEIVLPPGSVLTDEYASLGVQFEPNLFYNPDPSVLNPPDPSIPSNNAIGNFVIEGASPAPPPTISPFTIDLTETQSDVAFAAATAFPGEIELTALLGGVEVESFSASTPGSIDPTTGNLGNPAFNFYGFSDIELDAIEVAVQGAPNPVTGQSFDGVQIDNIQLGIADNMSRSVPESSSIVSLFAIATVAVATLSKSLR